MKFHSPSLPSLGSPPAGAVPNRACQVPFGGLGFGDHKLRVQSQLLSLTCRVLHDLIAALSLQLHFRTFSSMFIELQPCWSYFSSLNRLGPFQLQSLQTGLLPLLGSVLSPTPLDNCSSFSIQVKFSTRTSSCIRFPIVTFNQLLPFIFHHSMYYNLCICVIICLIIIFTCRLLSSMVAGILPFCLPLYSQILTQCLIGLWNKFINTKFKVLCLNGLR